MTTLVRTVVDCAASLPPDRGLVIADSALRAGADAGALDTALAARSGARGIVRARDVIALADGRAQSPGETLLRWSLHSGGLPPPELQVEVVTRRGRFFLDLGWPVPRVAVEFDGYVKYSGAFGRTAPEAVFAEKQRQDALEEEGWRVLRVTWDDLRAPAPLVARVARALSRSSR
ncbi:endonuclease domain-containing protein [Cellulomonas sp. PS-H5]|uniref:endonuclease domain-containing protein n=1 Tax=Cellulomonas sp. PS-H5 TaxID=2820400 RepID=UPI001C4EF699|nr:endonuclease domain-containing protein [Cellulomonas sp. PS-H5]MBW0253685.1 endonuclease domain-containing protein [Cellulomonas sp. PS-H5]